MIYKAFLSARTVNNYLE